MSDPVVSRDPEILSGTPVSRETKVPIRILFEYLEAGDSLAVFLDSFPSVSHEQAQLLLRRAKTS